MLCLYSSPRKQRNLIPRDQLAPLHTHILAEHQHCLKVDRIQGLFSSQAHIRRRSSSRPACLVKISSNSLQMVHLANKLGIRLYPNTNSEHMEDDGPRMYL